MWIKMNPIFIVLRIIYKAILAMIQEILVTVKKFYS